MWTPEANSIYLFFERKFVSCCVEWQSSFPPVLQTGGVTCAPSLTCARISEWLSVLSSCQSTTFCHREDMQLMMSVCKNNTTRALWKNGLKFHFLLTNGCSHLCNAAMNQLHGKNRMTVTLSLRGTAAKKALHMARVRGCEVARWLKLCSYLFKHLQAGFCNCATDDFDTFK